MSEWRDHFNEGMDHDEIRVALKMLPSDLAGILQNDIAPVAKYQKIQAIKALREESGFSLKLAKWIVDEICAGTPILIGRCNDPEVVNAIEQMEALCKATVRKIRHDGKTSAVLLGIRDRLANLWTDLVVGEDPDEDAEE